MLGLCCEGCCCDVLSLSIARIFTMDKKRLHPDPGDYQIIAFSNCMQMVACLCYMLAYVEPSFQDLATIVDIIADIVERCVSGCMSAQLNLEFKDKEANSSAKGNALQFANTDFVGAPAVAIDDASKDEAIKEAEVMEREN
jgi:hypothetical protein